jgi:hypothetical protein
MTRQDRQRLSILIVLLVVFAFTAVLAYRMNRPVSTAAVQTPAAKTSAKPLTATEARIRLDLVDKSAGAQSIGRNNVFQYRQASAPPGSSNKRPGASPESPETGPTPSTAPPPVPIRPQPPAPPPLPPIPFKYQGFAIIAANNTLTAFLSDDSSRHYNVTAGEILMGRYRIVQVSDKSVEVEDVENNRRQTLPLVK